MFPPQPHVLHKSGFHFSLKAEQRVVLGDSQLRLCRLDWSCLKVSGSRVCLATASAPSLSKRHSRVLQIFHLRTTAAVLQSCTRGQTTGASFICVSLSCLHNSNTGVLWSSPSQVREVRSFHFIGFFHLFDSFQQF